MPQLFTGIKPYKRSDIVSLTDSLEKAGVFTSAADRFNLEYLRIDNHEWSQTDAANSEKPVLKHFYRKKSDLFHVAEDNFDLHVNPVLYVGAGRDSQQDDMLFLNTRGVEVRGMVDRKVGFYTVLTENQAVLPTHARTFVTETGAVPHEGFWKQYKDGPGVDFLHARGYLTFNATRHINLQFGHDRFFVGNGMRSLVFSDFGPAAAFIRGNLKIWKINYLFQVNQMVADPAAGPNGSIAIRGYPNKYTALHHLSVNIGKKLTLGVYEAVVFAPDDPAVSDNFRIDYLNPIIFYRAIEQQNGSSDNVLLGFDFKFNPVKKLSFYGQFLLDEFVIDEIRSGNGWWANKFGIQAGGKYIDAFGIANLDLQGEVNIVRPYTYSHTTQYGDYSSYNQAIAHPLGANFTEIAGVLRYQPLPRLNVTGKLILIGKGLDGPGQNAGGDILKSTEGIGVNFGTLFGNTIGQGVQTDILFGSFAASWQLRHNLFIDGNFLLRESKSELVRHNVNSSVASLAVRWNIAQRHYEF